MFVTLKNFFKKFNKKRTYKKRQSKKGGSKKGILKKSSSKNSNEKHKKKKTVRWHKSVVSPVKLGRTRSATRKTQVK